MFKTTCFLFSVFAVLLSANLPAGDDLSAEKQRIQAVDNEYIKAFNAKDAVAATASFTDDAVYRTEDGRELKGKGDIQNALKEQFDAAGDSTLNLKVYNVEIKPDQKHATERGISIVTTDGIEEPSSYVADFEKVGEQWRVSKVVEQAQAPNTEHLNQLSWMIGEWVDQSEDASVRTTAEWALDRAFIIRKFAVSAPGRREMKGIEYIGWNPARNAISSWYFDSDGGYGGGNWHKEGNRWVEVVTGLTPKGEVAGSTLIFTPKDDNSFTWQSTNRHVAGEKLEDVPEVTITRSKGELSSAPRGQL
jgi:uncharacterized protein (TIGR02246 family)